MADFLIGVVGAGLEVHGVTQSDPGQSRRASSGQGGGRERGAVRSVMLMGLGCSGTALSSVHLVILI